MTNQLHIKEEAIQAEWLEMARKKADAESLCTDGLLFRGPITYCDGFWTRTPGSEEELWREARRRLMFLTKDLNDDEGWDIRQETGRFNEAAFSYERAISFYKNLRMWSYLMLKAEIGQIPLFKEARDMNVTGPFYESAPIVRINCKKQVGGDTLSDPELKRYLKTYALPLRRQIELYDANILFCCGCSNDKNLILDFVKAQYLPDLRPIPGTGDWIFFSSSTGKIAVNSYHPSARIGYEETYYNLAEAFETALKWLKNNYKIIF